MTLPSHLPQFPVRSNEFTAASPLYTQYPLLEKLCLLGQSQAARRLRAQVHVIAPHLRTVFLLAEPGVDPRPIVQQLHRLGPQSHQALLTFSAVDLNRIADLGNERAAAFLSPSNRGPIFVSDVDRLSAAGQALLLRFLQREADAATSTWLVASSTRSLHGRFFDTFSPALVHCLTAVTIEVPAISSRVEDLPLVVEALLAELPCTEGRPTPSLTSEASSRLEDCTWPEDLAQIVNVLAEAHQICKDGVITASVLDGLLQGEVATEGDEAADVHESLRLEDVVTRHVLAVLRRCEGNKLRTADLLGVSRSTLYRMLEAHAA